MVRKYIGKVWFIIIIIFGLIMIFHKSIENYIMKEKTSDYSILNVEKEDIEQNQIKDANFNVNQVESISVDSITASLYKPKSTDYLVVGGVSLPDVKINLPIFKGISNYSLLYGAGTLFEDQKMGEGNYALASHRALSPELLFSSLEKVKMGQSIYLTDLTYVYKYIIFNKVKVSPTDTQLLNNVEGKKQVTLITCGDANAITRLVVQGRLDSKRKCTKSTLAPFEISSKTY